MTNSHEGTCEKCGSQMMECYVDQELNGMVVKKPQRDQLFKNKKNTYMNPVICSNCGFVEWFASNPKSLF